MEKGSSMERCVNTEEEEDVFGTLYIQLPSVFSGGEINVYSGDEKEDVNEFNLGGTGDNNHSCHFVCHYADCEYEMAKIKSGSRVLLRYSLHYFGGGEMPTTNMLKDVKPLTRLLELLPQNRKMIIVPVADDDCTPRCLKYDSSSLLNKGITALDDDNRANAELIKAAGGKSWKVLIVNAKMTWTETFSGCDCCGGHSDSYSEHAIVEIFDEEGNDVTEPMKWLKGVADFDCVSRRDFQGSIREQSNVDAMLLGVKENNITYSSEGYSSNWGVCVSETETSTGYNSDTDYYGYGGGYDDHGHTKTQQYSGTFLLAYDTAAEVDLNCLGGVEGVSMVASKIVDTKDTCLLDRLLSTVETSKGKFNISSCQQLLEMMTTSTRRRDALSINNIDRINKILKGLSTSFEPNKELFATILTAGDKFGHQNLSVSVLKLLTDTGRLRQHEITAFLCRVNFILELNKRLGNQFSYVENSIRDLSTHGRTTITNAKINEIKRTIATMIVEYGWELMKDIVNATLTQLHKTRPKLDHIMNRGQVLRKIQGLNGYPEDFLQPHLVEFASDFVASLNNTTTTVVIRQLTGTTPSDMSNKRIFVRTIDDLFKYGEDSAKLGFGAFFCKSNDILTALLKLLTESPKLHNKLAIVFNNSLVQTSISSLYGWSDGWEMNGRNKSIHIRKALQALPTLAKKKLEGRPPLHYAAASNTASFDTVMDILEANPEAASVSDPVSGLFPFQLAASNGNIGASFSLLLADPTLVLTGIQLGDTTEETRKRKRTE